MAYDPQIKRTINGTDVVPIINAAPQAMVTGTITSATSTITATDLQGIGAATVSIYGTYAGVNATFEVFDGVNWYAVLGKNVASLNADATVSTGVLTANTSIMYNVAPLLGVQQFRVRATAYTSGTANVVIEPSTQFINNMQHVAGNMAVLSVVAGTGATSLGKAEDAVAATGDTGVAVWSVRNDGTATTPASATGDYQQISSDLKGTVFTRHSPANTATLTNVTAATTSTTLLAANTNRRSAIIYNDSGSDMFLSYGGTASSTSFTVYVPSFSTVTIPGSEYSGVLNGIWLSALGAARVTETVVT